MYEHHIPGNQYYLHILFFSDYEGVIIFEFIQVNIFINSNINLKELYILIHKHTAFICYGIATLKS